MSKTQMAELGSTMFVASMYYVSYAVGGLSGVVFFTSILGFGLVAASLE